MEIPAKMDGNQRILIGSKSGIKRYARQAITATNLGPKMTATVGISAALSPSMSFRSRICDQRKAKMMIKMIARVGKTETIFEFERKKNPAITSDRTQRAIRKEEKKGILLKRVGEAE